MSKIKTLLELARISNLPTVWSNTLVGVVAGLGLSSDNSPFITLQRAWPLMAGMSLFYIGGMILNDAVDAPIDAKERPHRPIPSGRISGRHAFFLASTCLVGGLIALILDYHVQSMALVWGGALVASVVFYNLLHKYSALSVLLMGACRGFIVLTSAAAMGESLTLVPLAFAAALTLYTVGLSLIARDETQMARGPKLIMRLIALMSLLDGVFLLIVGQTWLVLFAVGCWAITSWGHKKILGS